MTFFAHFFTGLKSLSLRYFEHKIAKSSARIAYDSLFALFPTFLAIRGAAAKLGIARGSVIHSLSGALPDDVVNIFSDYNNYLLASDKLISGPLLIAAVTAAVFSVITAINHSSEDIRTSYNIRTKPGFFQYLWSILITFILIAAFVSTVFLFSLGEDISELLKSRYISAELFNVLRFYVFPICVFLVMTLFYFSASLFRFPFYKSMPGAAFTVVIWCVSSYFFTLYVKNFSRYSLFYGPIGGVIVFLIWLYLLSNVLLIGAEVNSLIIEKSDSERIL